MKLKNMAALLFTFMPAFLLFGCFGCEDYRRIDDSAFYTEINGDTFYITKNEDNTYTIKAIAYLADSIVEVPSHINGVCVTALGDGAFAEKNVGKVIIPKTVKTIGRYAFSRCYDLVSVEFAHGSELESIEMDAFDGCTSLTSISLPPSLKIIQNSAFARTGLTSITIGANIEHIGIAVFAFSPIAEFYVDDASLTYCTENGILYNKGKSILVAYPYEKREADFSAPSTVTEVYYSAFEGNSYIQNVNLNNTQTIYDQAFLNCENLSSIIGNSVISVGQEAFKNTKILNMHPISYVGKVLLKYNGTAETLELNDYKSISENAFYANPNLKTIYLGGELEFLYSNAFYGCTSLKEIYITTGYNVFVGRNAFDLTPSLEKIYVPAIDAAYYEQNENLSPYASKLSTHATTIHYDTNGGSVIADDSIEYYSPITVRPTPTKEGYYFAGWTYTVDGETIPVTVGNTWLQLIDEVTFSAQWTPNEYSVILYPNGGAVDPHILYYTVEDSVTLPMPQRTGYTFAGWYENEDLTGTPVTSLDVGTYGNKLYYAKWQPNTYTLTLNYNYDGAPSPSTETVIFGEMYVLPVPEREGYYFNGWKCNDSMVTSDSGILFQKWHIADNQTLYAVWTKKSYEIEIKSDGTVVWLTESNEFSDEQEQIG